MSDVSDMDLLREYHQDGSEEAFARLVQRHLDLVYSAAFRHVGVAAQAEEITQAVFVILARKGPGLRPDTILEGWLYETTRFTSLSFMRGERRRQFREQEAYMQSKLRESHEDSDWNQLAPLLDEAMSRLGKKDRDALMLRFFKEKSMREVAAALQVNESAAQRRVLRAVEKLRTFFAKRGVAISAVAIGGLMTANSVQAAPAGLAVTVTATAAKGAVASGSTLALIKGASKLMAWSKMKTAAVVALVVIPSTLVITTIVKRRVQPQPAVAATPGDWIWEPDSRTLERVPPLLILQPSPKSGRVMSVEMMGKNRYMARGKTLKELLLRIYSQKNSQQKLTFLATLPNNKFDCIVTLETKWWDALEAEINQRFHLVTQRDAGTENTMVVKNAN